MNTQVCYQVDAKLSQLTVHAFASGLAAVVAHNPKFAIRDFSGDARFTPGSLGEASIRLKIKSSSLDLMDEVSEYDRREIGRVTFEEVLEIRRFRRSPTRASMSRPISLARTCTRRRSPAIWRSTASPIQSISPHRWSWAKTRCAATGIFQ